MAFSKSLFWTSTSPPFPPPWGTPYKTSVNGTTADPKWHALRSETGVNSKVAEESAGLGTSHTHCFVNPHERIQVKRPGLHVNPFWIRLLHNELPVTHSKQRYFCRVLYFVLVTLSMLWGRHLKISGVKALLLWEKHNHSWLLRPSMLWGMSFLRVPDRSKHCQVPHHTHWHPLQESNTVS